MSLPLDKMCILLHTWAGAVNAAVLKMLCLRFWIGFTPVLFKYLSHNKAFHFKASSTYFLLRARDRAFIFKMLSVA